MTTFTRTGCAVAALLTATAAQAGGLDRSGQPIGAIFNDPGTVELSFGRVFPSVEGSDINGPGSYSIAQDYNQFGASVTTGSGGPISFSAILDEPYGADVFYNDDPTASFLGGTFADLDSTALSLVTRYEVTPRISVYGGARIQSISAQVALRGLAYGNAIVARGAAPQLIDQIQAFAASGAPGSDIAAGVLQQAAQAPGGVGTVAAGVLANAPEAQDVIAALNAAGLGAQITGAQQQFAQGVGAFAAGGGYSVDIDQSTALGYLVGAAYEIPDIALRASITYFSEIDHEADAAEFLAVGFPGIGTDVTDTIRFSTPEAVNIDFQTGVAEGTLLLAGYRFTNYDDTDVIPENLGSDIVNINAVHRFSLGVGRQLSEALSGSAVLSYEREDGDLKSPLGPTDGQIGLTVGARYRTASFDISGGLNYTKTGSAQAEIGGRPVAQFDDGHAVGIGIRGVYRF